MRIGIAKPDYWFVGGYERYLDRLVGGIEARGHEVGWMRVPVPGGAIDPFHLGLTEQECLDVAELARFAWLVHEFRACDASEFDVVLSTQPGSYAVPHARHVSLFFHHHRIYYDLADLYVEAGFSPPALYERAQAIVHRIDAQLFEGVSLFLAGSTTVDARLQRFSPHPLPTALLRSTGLLDSFPVDQPRSGVLCVSRHEFPKRIELLVAAMKRLPAVVATVIGDGSRLPWARSVDARLSAADVDLDSVDERALWVSRGLVTRPWRPPAASNVQFLLRVGVPVLRLAMASAVCVVAPAYDEDYGLTAIEAMAAATPVIVCNDGGGLVELVEDEVTGLVVEPTGTAIAAAVRRLVDDPDLARRLGENGQAVARTHTLDAEVDSVLHGLEQVLG